ncbi:MAG: hypothetical protein HZB56_06265 [Deltaproteobacteria bacterium]|nr:hypothetical protein [Deltaproteobacteria bacterium]
MRRLALAVLLALAGTACSVKTEGAACTIEGESNCPAGQACGYDGKCSEEAAGCGTICTQHSCSGQTLRRCEPTSAVCAALQQNGTTCEASQACDATAGACVCRDNACTASSGLATCDAGGNLVTCMTESSTQCRLVDTSAPCGAGSTCLGSAGGAACVSLAIELPAANARVGGPSAPSIAVEAAYTASSASFSRPATIELLADGSARGTLSWNESISRYTGTYAPQAGLEQSVDLTVRLVAGSATAVSPARPVDVDTLAPRVGTLTASCTPSPCPRDGVLDVSVTVTESHPGPVTASLDLDGTKKVPLVGAAGSYSGHLALADWPFPHFTQPLVVHVHAEDEPGNVTPPAQEGSVSVPDGITRARLAYPSGGTDPVTSPAILSNGNAIVGIGVPGTSATDQLRAVAPDGSETWKRTLSVNTGLGRAVTAAPAAGEHQLFVASDDGRLYQVTPSGTVVGFQPGDTDLGTNTGAMFTPWLSSPGTTTTVDHGFSAGEAAQLWQYWSSGRRGQSTLTDRTNASGIWAGAVTVLATNAVAPSATLRRFNDPQGTNPAETGTLALVDAASTACDKVSVPLAADSATTALVACDNRQLHRVDVSAATLAGGYLLQLPGAPSGSPVVLPGGDVLVPLATGEIARVIAPATAPELATFAALAAGEIPRGLAIAAANGPIAPATVYVTTGNGKLYAFIVGQDPRTPATDLWPAAAIATSALDFPTIAPVPSGAPAGTLPTLLVGSADGRLLRVVVDAPLDAAAPWPKAHHDVRNTGNSATPVNGP